jgi:serine/threonine-protein kinase HipA
MHPQPSDRPDVEAGPDDEFSMLLAVGGDTIGDVQVVPAGDTPADTTPIIVDDFSKVVFAELFAQAIGQQPDRTALPGVQDKISGQMLNVPVQGRAGAYILKLNPPESPHLVENEDFFFRAAAHTRLRLAKVELVNDQVGAPGLLVHRFDRIPQGDHLRPLAVEDACQVLGRWPGDKYIISTEDAITSLARRCRAPGVAALELFRLLIFAYLSGNGDLHAKNLAILQDQRGEWKITPVYDLPSSAIYGDRDMASPSATKFASNSHGQCCEPLVKQSAFPTDSLLTSSTNKLQRPTSGSENLTNSHSMRTASANYGDWSAPALVTFSSTGSSGLPLWVENRRCSESVNSGAA